MSLLPSLIDVYSSIYMIVVDFVDPPKKYSIVFMIVLIMCTYMITINYYCTFITKIFLFIISVL